MNATSYVLYPRKHKGLNQSMNIHWYHTEIQRETMKIMETTTTETKSTTEIATHTKTVFKVRATSPIMEALVVEMGFPFTEKNKLFIFDVPLSEVNDTKTRLRLFKAEYCIEYPDSTIYFSVSWGGEIKAAEYISTDPTKVCESLYYDTYFKL